MARSESLPRRARLHHASEFREVYDNGTPFRGRHLVLVALSAAEGGSVKAGVVASRKVGDAVRRNRAKRLLREAYRKVRAEIGAPARLVLVATRECPAASASVVQAELRVLLARARLLPQNGPSE